MNREFSELHRDISYNHRYTTALVVLVLSFRCTIHYHFMSILRVIHTPAEAAPHALCLAKASC